MVGCDEARLRPEGVCRRKPRDGRVLGGRSDPQQPDVTSRNGLICSIRLSVEARTRQSPATLPVAHPAKPRVICPPFLGVPVEEPRVVVGVVVALGQHEQRRRLAAPLV